MKSTIKKKLFQSCDEFVKGKLKTITTSINSNKSGLESETKSSAGDKHETGRAMLQLEMEKAGQQLNQVQQMKLLLEKIDTRKTTQLVCLGSVVQTNFVSYFMAISVGKIEAEGKDYYAISPSSPIGKLILGKEIGDTYTFRGKKNTITDVF